MKKQNEFDSKQWVDEEGEQGEQGGTGGSVGEIEFHYRDIFSAESRDDLLSPEELNRLLAVHIHLHKDYVTKQRNLRKERKARKEGPANLTTLDHRGTYQMGDRSANYKMHPIAMKAQFSGATDQKVVNVAGLNTAETNEENKDKLENRYQNQLRLQNAPKFNPKPRPY